MRLQVFQLNRYSKIFSTPYEVWVAPKRFLYAILISLQVEQHRLHNFEIEIGGMDYGFEINGILGMDFLIRAKAIINLAEMRVDFAGSL